MKRKLCLLLAMMMALGMFTGCNSGKNSENKEKKNKYYYSEKFNNEDQEDNETPDIVHIIMANDSPDSPAGQYYNDVAIDFLRSSELKLNALCKKAKLLHFDIDGMECNVLLKE